MSVCVSVCIGVWVSKCISVCRCVCVRAHHHFPPEVVVLGVGPGYKTLPTGGARGPVHDLTLEARPLAPAATVSTHTHTHTHTQTQTHAHTHKHNIHTTRLHTHTHTHNTPTHTHTQTHAQTHFKRTSNSMTSRTQRSNSAAMVVCVC